MFICKLLQEKIQNISNIETWHINPVNNDEKLEILSKELKTLQSIKTILELDQIILDKLDEVIVKNQIDPQKLDINSLVVSKYQDITDSTIVWDSTFNTLDFEQFNPAAISLPKNLQVIMGEFVMKESTMKNISLTYVGKTCFIAQNLLESLVISYAGDDLYLQFCPELKSLTLETVVGKIDFTKCSKLKIENVSSITGGKIKVGNRFINKSKHGLYGSEAEILNKFDIGFIRQKGS